MVLDSDLKNDYVWCMSIEIISFYKFIPFTSDKVNELEDRLKSLATDLDDRQSCPLSVRGLTILGTEGINATYSVDKKIAEEFKRELCKIFALDNLPFKLSWADKHAFHDFKIKVRKEIVTLERPDLVPTGTENHASPDEWHRMMKNDDPVVIDTRNSYEYEIGHFKGALNPQIEEFSEFPGWLKKMDLPKDKKVLIYCTGGIRCEKAILEMQEQGFSDVHQLDGGIIKYLEAFKESQPESLYDGECFVFDYRVAVDHDLNPTQKYKLCPHCGQPAACQIDCVQCGRTDVVCDTCLTKGETEAGSRLKNQYHTCSKNCAHHFRMGHKTERVHHDAFNRRVISG